MGAAEIIAMIPAMMQVLQMFVTMGLQISQAVQAAQGTPAAPHVAALSDAHAAMGAPLIDMVKGVTAAATAAMPK